MDDHQMSQQVTLCDALDRLLNKGVVVHGDIIISVAGVDLLYVSLRGLVAAVDALDKPNRALTPFAPGYKEARSA